MDGVDQTAQNAARVILRGEQVLAGESSAEALHSLLNTFFSLAQLTPLVALPEAVKKQVEERLAAQGTSENPTAGAWRRSFATGRVAEKRRRSLVRRVADAKVKLPLTAMIMVSLALLLSIGANVLLARSHAFRPADATYLTTTGSAPDARAVILNDGRELVFFATGLAELTSGYRYVAWTSSREETRRLGTLTMLSSTSARLLVADAELMELVIVTIEPSASPREPSGPNILVGVTGR